MSESFSVNDSWCPMHGIGARQRRTTVPNTASAGQITWWECPQCNVSTTIPCSAAAGIPSGSLPVAQRLYTEAEVERLRARIADLECQPLVLITQRVAYATALTDAQVCDAAEAERRALRAYPSPAEENRA